VVVVKKKKKKSDDEDGEEDEEEEVHEEEPAPEEDEEEQKKKLKKVLAPPVAPLLVGRPEPSARDKMIELKWKGLINQSSVMLCISNFLCSKIFICNVDIKTRSRDIKFTISTTSKPTCMY